MVNWLTRNIGTGPYLEVIKHFDSSIIVDTRNIVDKDGNTSEAILSLVSESLRILNQYDKVIICCDYGMSRSNSIATAVITKHLGISFSSAVDIVVAKVSVSGIKPEVLDGVFSALNPKRAKKEDNRRILVTGGSGFLGIPLINKLKEKYFIKGISSQDCDLQNDAVKLNLLVKENSIDTLIHLANPRIYTLNTAMGDSLTMLKNVLEICRLNELRLIFLSSWEVYSGYQGENIRADESMPVFPKGAYAETKWLGESLICHYAKTFNLKYTIIRSTPVYGSGSDKPKFIYNFLDKALRGEPIVTHRYINGSPLLDLLYSADLIAAIEKVVDQSMSNVFNVGSGQGIATRQVAEMIVRLSGSNSNIMDNHINSYYPGIIFNTSKAKDLLQWEPVGSFESFLTSVINLRISHA